MDKISKLRRKPKPPAIETSVDRSKSVEPPFEETSADSLHPGRLSRLSGRISPFRQIRFRTSPGKRAHSSPPVGALPSSPMAAASSSVSVVQQDGVMPRVPRSRGRNGPSGAGTPRIPEFLTYSKTEIDNKYQDLTWAERNRVSESVRADTDESSKWFIFKQPQVAEKGLMDRYPNIRPWNYNRVRLQVAEDELDYVNASDIILPEPTDESKKPLRYIAMQGPTEPSFNYVWRMVAEQLSPQASIVQLTGMLEGGFIKCHQYFPFTEEESTWNLNEDDIWGDGWKATLTFDSLEEYADGAIEKRKLLLHVQGEEEPRVIWHFLFHCWPDFGVPDLGDLDSFFELMKLSREHSDPAGTRIIHCSAGVGRTGTFISIEHLLRELDSDAFTDREACPDNTDPVFDTVEELRQQRRGMVQGVVQFTFIYQVVRKLWQEKYNISDDRLRSGSEPASKRLEVPELLISDETDDEEMNSDYTDPASSDAGAARIG